MTTEEGTEGSGSTGEFGPHVLQQYAFLADGEGGILVGPKGDYAFMCAPRWDSDAVFSSLIGGGGLYAVTPVLRRFVWSGYYEDGSLIWRSRWITSDGVIECREALAFPGDPHTAVVLRRVVACDGPAQLRVILNARAGFGVHEMGRLRAEDGVWTALRPEPVRADEAWSATEEGWASAVPPLSGTLAPREVRDSYAVLRGMTSSGGGMVAAATMSLPERAGAGRSYDYRYVWLRDQAYAAQACASYGPLPLLDSAVSFVADRICEDGPHLKPAYTVTGGRVPDERALSHLDGYPGGADKVGNWVNQQFQLDGLGESLLLFAAAARHDHLDLEHWRDAQAAVDVIKARWGDPDAGIWELDDHRWAHSRLTCVAGLRAIAGAAAPRSEAGAWSALADAILADVASDCVHPSGRWQRAPDDQRVDAALLMPPLRGALSSRDPRTLATLRSVEEELGGSGYVYRFRQDQRPLEDAEGAFVLCGFVMALALHQQGRTAEAHAWFERHRAACGPPGLFAEEFDVRQRQLRGNIPQAFVHALLFEAATRLTTPWQEVSP